jgi:hypothetical protein
LLAAFLVVQVLNELPVSLPVIALIADAGHAQPRLQGIDLLSGGCFPRRFHDPEETGDIDVPPVTSRRVLALEVADRHQVLAVRDRRQLERCCEMWIHRVPIRELVAVFGPQDLHVSNPVDVGITDLGHLPPVHGGGDLLQVHVVRSLSSGPVRVAGREHRVDRDPRTGDVVRVLEVDPIASAGCRGRGQEYRGCCYERGDPGPHT